MMPLLPGVPPELDYELAPGVTITIRNHDLWPAEIYADHLLKTLNKRWRYYISPRTVMDAVTYDDVRRHMLGVADILVWAGYDSQTIADFLSAWLHDRHDRWLEKLIELGPETLRHWKRRCPYQWHPWDIGNAILTARRQMRTRMHRSRGTGPRQGELKYRIHFLLSADPRRIWTPKKIARELGVTANSVRMALKKMARRREVIRLAKGKYQCRDMAGYVPFELAERYGSQPLESDLEVPF